MTSRNIVPVRMMFSIVLAVAGLFMACTGGPTVPSRWRLAAPVEPAIRLEIEGPPVVVLGAVVQFSLIAHASDGSRRDVTNEATWSESAARLMSWSGPGLVVGLQRGDTYIAAQFETYHRQREVVVLPDGTYKLVLRVSESRSPDAVAGARVDVTAGVEAPLTGYTDGSGTYRLYGAAGETVVRITKEGFQPVTRSFDVTSHQEHSIELNFLD